MPDFRLVLRNVGRDSLLLNGGSMLGNGKQIWNSVGCVFRNPAGQEVPLRLHWGVSHVAGRIYFLGVPLRPGDEHSIQISPHDYHVDAGKPLSAGVYELRCSYRGEQSQYRDRTQLPLCWEGQVVAQPVRFEVRGANPEATGTGDGSLAGGMGNIALHPTAAGFSCAGDLARVGFGSIAAAAA